MRSAMVLARVSQINIKKKLTLVTLFIGFGLSTLPVISIAAPYQVEIDESQINFVRANTREQDFGSTLTITGPDDYLFQQTYAAGESIVFSIDYRRGEALFDGQYNYELIRLAPQQQRSDTPLESDSLKLAAESVSGVFTINQGSFVTQQDEVPAGQRDQIINDDLIVIGNICVGLDCVNNESFEFDTLRIKENNTRIRFFDTSNSASFPSNDWQLSANDTTNGGANRFSIEDLDAGRIPFSVEAGAPNSSIYIDDSGRVGFGNSTPLLDIHVSSSNTPALRLDQNASGGFPSQIWDIGANESEFFIRDISAVQVPFRIIPGAPNDSFHMNFSGDVGLGTNSPASELHIQRVNNGPSIRLESIGTPNRSWDNGVRDSDGDFSIDDNMTPATELIVRGNGNLEIAGSLISMANPEVPVKTLKQPDTLLPLDQLQDYIDRNQQLPGISQPAGTETTFSASKSQQSQGHDVVAFQMKLLEKIQELTLYTLQQQERINALESELSALKAN